MRWCIIAVLVLLIVLPLRSTEAQTPDVMLNLPAENFVGEQFCFSAEITNSGAPGYGPYLHLILPPEITLDSATFLNLGVTTTTIGVFPAAPANQLTDPVTGDPITGEPGHTLLVIELPIGSVVSGAPPLVVEMCATISTTAVVGQPLPVTLTPVYEFGNTPTGANGPIVGSTVTEFITPTLYIFNKTSTAPEGERPPGPSWFYDYELTVDIANGQTITDLEFSDTLPAEVQYVEMVSVETGCTVVTEPSTTTPGGTLAVTCDSASGLEGGPEVMVSFRVYIIDILNQATCGRDTLTNTASFAASYQGVPQPLSTAETLVEAEHISLQKSASPGLTIPGTLITYTLDFQITDYDGETSSLSVTSTLPDGISYTSHQSMTVGGTGYAIAPTVVDNIDGSQSITYNISTAVGSSIPASTAITLVFTGTIDQFYADGTPVHTNDDLPDSVVATYTLAAGAPSCTEDSGAGTSIEPVTISKSIVNPPPYIFMPGETVTFRLAMDIPSGDTRAVYFEDFFPLPVFDVTTVNTTFGTDIRFAPGSTITTLPTAISVNAAQNSLRIDWPDIESDTPPEVLAIDIEITVEDDPFADNLYLTNLFQAGYANTPGSTFTADFGVFFYVRAPDLMITKGVLATNGSGTIDPPPSIQPVDGDLTGADALDTVTYTLTVENVGGAPAYDVTVTDPPVPGLAFCAVTGVTNWMGTPLAHSGDLFGTGLVLTDPLAAGDGIAGPPYGADTALISVTCLLAPTVEPLQTITNTAAVTWASLSGSTDFPTRSDDASVETGAPAITKAILSTNQAHTTNPTVAVGEQVTYRVTVTVPEGTSSSATLTDVLDAGLAFVSVDSITASPGVTTSVAGGFDAVRTGAVIGSEGTGATSPGRRLALDFGTVVNGNDSPGVPETITLEYTVVVLNSTNNNAGGGRNNAVTWAWSNSGAGSFGSVSASASNVVIREPVLTVSKTATPATGDAGNEITFTIELSHSGASTNPNAYNVVFTDTVPAGLTLVPGSFTTGACATTAPGLTEAAPEVAALWGAFRPDGVSGALSCTLTYRATLDADVLPDQVLTNTADIAWSSLPGDITAPQSGYNSLSCERTGSPADCGGASNDYARSAAATVTVDPIGITKSITSTSLNGSAAHTAAQPDYTIGEEITYQFSVTLPEGQTSATVFDQLPTGASVLEVVSSRVVAVGAHLSGAGLPAVGAAGAPSDTDTDGVNDRVTWSLGTVSNVADGGVTDADRIIFEVVARVLDVAANADGDVPVNTAQIDYGASGSVSDTASMDIVEPSLSITKTATPDSGDAGDIITFRLAIAHTAASTATAYDVVLADIVPDNLTYTTANFALRAVPGQCAAAPTSIDTADPDNSTPGAPEGLVVTWDEIAPGAGCTLEFEASIDPTAPAAATLTNTGALDWRSLPGDGREYTASHDADVDILQNGLTKIITAPLDGDATIGEEITYEFTVDFAEGVTLAAVVTDQLPVAADGAVFEVVSSQVTAVGAHLSGAALPAVGAAGTPSDTDADGVNDGATWILGDITNAPDDVLDANDAITFQVVARVVDAAANVGLVTSQDTGVLNTASIQHSGGTVSGTVGIDLIEPQLAVSKANDAAGLLDAGNSLTITLTISHTAQSLAEAHNITLTDTLPAPGLSWVGDGTVGGTCGAAVDSTGAPDIVFSFAALPLGSSCTITYQAAVSDDAGPNSTYTNTVSGTYDSLPAGGRTGSMGPVESSFSTALPAITKTVTATTLADTAGSDLAIGEEVTYTVVITLPEGVTSDVVITDVAPPGDPDGVIEITSASVTAQGASLSPALVGTAGALSDALLADGSADTATFSLGDITNAPDNTPDADDTLTITVVGRLRDVPANAAGDTLTNTATLSYATGPDLTASADVTVVEPGLQLTKTFVDTPASPGDTVQITLVITNTGAAPAYGVTIQDVLDGTLWDVTSAANVSAPAGFTFSNTPAGTVQYAGGTVFPGAASAVTLTFEATLLTTLTPADSPVSNTAAITAAGTLPGGGRDASGATDDDDLPLVFPDLAITKTSSGTLQPGDTLVYDLEIDNIGSGPSGPITITESVPANTAFNAASSSTGWSCADGAPAGTACTYSQAALAPADAAVTVQFAVTVVNPLPAGVTGITNAAQVSDDGSRGGDVDTSNNEDDAANAVTAASDLSAEKTANLFTDVNGDGVANPGDTLEYTIEITNTGDQDAAGAIFTDTPGANTTLVVGSVTPAGSVTTGNTPGDTSVEVAVGDIPGAGGSVTITFRVTIDAPLPAGVEAVANQGSLSGDNFPDIPTDDPGTTDPGDPTETPVIAAPDIAAAKTDVLLNDVNGDGVVNPGDVIEYTVVITNTGDQDAANVVFTDTPDANTTLVAGSVTPAGSVTTGNTPGDTAVEVAVGDIPGAGGSATITFDVVLNNPLPAGPLTIANQGVINGDEIPTDTPTDDPDTTAPDDPTETPFVAAPDVAVTKTDALVVDANADGVANPGDVIEYTVVITNSGDKGAAGVTFSDTPDPNTTLVVGSVTPAGSVTTGNTPGDTSVEVAVGDIPGAGGSVTITFRVEVVASLPVDVTGVTNQGQAQGDDIPDTPSDDPDTTDPDDPTETPVDGTPDLSASKVDSLFTDVNGDGVANPGDTLEYTVVITNAGTRHAASVIFSDTPGANTTLVAGSVTTTLGAVTTGNDSGDTTVEVTVGDLPGAGESVTITFRVTIDDPLVPPTTIQVENQGRVSGGNFTELPTDDPATTLPDDPTITPLILAPIIVVEKTDALLADLNANASADPGDTLRYTVTIRNQGAVQATGVTFSDTPDPNTTLVVGSVTGGTVITGNLPGDTSVTVTVGAIAAESEVTITFDVTINDPLDPVTTTRVANQGIVSGDDFAAVPSDDPDTPDPNDPTSTLLAGSVLLTADKQDALLIDADGDGAASPGDTLEYTVTITNPGTSDALNVVFSDTPGANTALVAGSVTTTQGAVTGGNVTGDSDVAVEIGTLAGGDTVTVVFQATINSTLVPASTTFVRNQGTVTGDNTGSTPTNDPDTPSSDDPTDTPVGTSSGTPSDTALLVTKTDRLFQDSDGDGFVTAGDVLQYTVVITNPGPDAARDVVFNDTPGLNTALMVGTVTTTQGVIPRGNTAGDTAVTVSVGELLPGVSVTINFRVTLDNPLPAETSFVANQGVVSSAGQPDVRTDDPATPPEQDRTVTPIGAIPWMEVYKTAALTGDANTDGDANPGDLLTYTITLTNYGSVGAENVIFSDPLPAEVTLVAGSVTVSDPAALVTEDAGLTVTLPDPLAPGASVTITVVVQIQPALSPSVQQVRNQGVASGGNFPDEPSDDPATPAEDDPTVVPVVHIPVDQPDAAPQIVVFDPAISKIGVLEPGGLGLPGERLTWMFTISNVGSGPGFDVQIMDTLVPELRINSVSIEKGTYAINGQTVTFRIDRLDPGETISASIVTTVLRSPADGVLRNTAALSGAGADAVVITASAQAEVAVVTGLPATGYPLAVAQEPQSGRLIFAAFGLSIIGLGLLIRHRRWQRRS